MKKEIDVIKNLKLRYRILCRFSETHGNGTYCIMYIIDIAFAIWCTMKPCELVTRITARSVETSLLRRVGSMVIP